MGLIEIASGNSVWRGMDYYENKKVVSWKKTDEHTYSGTVAGSSGNTYTVSVNTEHPRKSICSCPFAEGRRVVCKHMIALYFTAEPNAAADFLKQVEEWEEEEAEQKKQHYKDLEKYVKSLSKAELQQLVLNALIESEERNSYY